MISRISLCICIGLLASCVQEPSAIQQEEDNRVTIGQKYSMASETLGEDRAYWVYLPASYDSSDDGSQHYPVMYLLDGNGHFPSASGVVQFMSSGPNGNAQIPELIIVAIPNTVRTRDLTPSHSTVNPFGEEAESLQVSGGGDAFLKFIRDELFPKIESDYRTIPHRTLVGHSFGGLMAVHALFEAPDMFQGHIAIDPSLWWDEELLVRRAEEKLSEERDRGAALYISLANTSDSITGEPSGLMTAARALEEILASDDFPDISSEMQYFAEESHASVPLISLYHGLLHVFDGYNFPISNVIANPSLAAVTAHFEDVSERMGVHIAPAEGIMNFLGYQLLYQAEDIDQAIEVFALNVSNYPKSFNVYDSLGEAYMVRGDTELAIENYEKSMVLNPDNTNGELQLEKLNDQK